MIDFTFEPETAILVLSPKSALAQSDFEQLAQCVDPFIENSGCLAGLIIDAPVFPGWDDFAAMAAHFQFVKDHHRQIKKVALVTDSALGNVAEHLASHFLAAEIKHFPAGETAAAKQWVLSRG